MYLNEKIMNKKEIKIEAYLDQQKKPHQLIEDVIAEANETKGDSQDRIKHLIKRMAIDQIILKQRADRTNNLLIILTIISTIVAILSLITTIRGFY
ncbi:MAG: hypothetical protein A3B38_03865 [Candidatus Levybacteria bacterium RIFCSPLOWO2_01_FULL_36_13]|nr:MAG: hypothetical protein A2684_00800 [Candidatus Levybacteria bacterium RIFCSPHIGHO2_01_FULL_36_15b]OGH34267.1 MAG: hypothetical protein A3B38_03865 [Candidatus Levybacteria bacterium RIFCSPLOWO2_01_FULL_36_13]